MNDIFTILADPNAIDVAYLYPNFGDLNTKKTFKCQNMSETRRHYDVISEGLDTTRTDVILRTRYDWGYAPEQHVFYRNKWYQISEVRPVELGTMGLIRPREFYLTLLEVNYGKDFENYGRHVQKEG